MNAYRIKELVATDPPQKESVWQSLAVIRHNPTLLLISFARLSQECSPKVQNAYFFENCTHYRIGNTEISGQNAEFLYGLFGGIPGTAAQFFANKIAARIGGMKRILLISRFDNLGKGACGAAIQNMNLLMGISETTGLRTGG